MLRKTVAVLICAAAFTYVSAQFSWESSFSGSASDTPSSTEESSSEEPSFGGFGSFTGEDESAPVAVEEPAPEPMAEADTPKRERAVRERPARERAARSAPAGFSSQKSCPVSNSTKIKKNLYVEHNGKRIHVSSAAYLGRVRRNPDAFIKILEKRGESPEG